MNIFTFNKIYYSLFYHIPPCQKTQSTLKQFSQNSSHQTIVSSKPHNNFLKIASPCVYVIIYHLTTIYTHTTLCIALKAVESWNRKITKYSQGPIKTDAYATNKIPTKYTMECYVPPSLSFT